MPVDTAENSKESQKITEAGDCSIGF